MWGRKRDTGIAAWPRRTGNWDELIHAYVDDMLPPRQRLEVEEYLAIHPDEAWRVADFRNQNRGFHELYDRYLLEPLPEEAQLLEQRIIEKLSRRRPVETFARAAATVAVAAVVAAGSWYGTQYYFTSTAPEFTLSALSDGPVGSDEAIVKVQPVGGIQNANVTSGGGQANESRNAVESAPDLTGFGFHLASSRQIGGHKEGSEAAQLVYESEKGRQITLYVSPTTDNARQNISVTQQGPISILMWTHKGRSYSLVGEVNRDEMLAIGAAVHSKWVKAAGPPAGTEGKAPADAPVVPDGRHPQDQGSVDGPPKDPFQPAMSPDQAAPAH